MFIPSFQSLMNALKTDGDRVQSPDPVGVPSGLLRLLLQVALVASDFDEEGYLKANPDVAGAIARGEVESARLHYIGYGYFEGRRGAGPTVDGGWYLNRYPDVAAAVREGRIESAEAHFHFIGAAEGRIPAPGYEEEALQWKAAMNGA